MTTPKNLMLMLIKRIKKGSNVNKLNMRLNTLSKLKRNTKRIVTKKTKVKRIKKTKKDKNKKHKKKRMTLLMRLNHPIMKKMKIVLDLLIMTVEELTVEEIIIILEGMLMVLMEKLKLMNMRIKIWMMMIICKMIIIRTLTPIILLLIHLINQLLIQKPKLLMSNYFYDSFHFIFSILVLQ